jgi:arginine/lysine/ornithine decarboxylase
MDITEIGGADVLYAPHGIIAESEANVTELFCTAHTFYSTEGSSLAIRAMLALVSEGATTPLILAARNAHKAFLYACALLDLDVEWLYPDQSEHICKAVITPKALSSKLQSMDVKPCAVYMTSPDYLGNIADIAALSLICKQYDIPLLVDNAHGAYLRFLDPSLHPISLGATACCDSAHKTLPVLTGGAYLHISNEAPDKYLLNARKYLSLFASTSPSYLILQSLDLCNAYVASDYQTRLSFCLKHVSDTKEYIRSRGFCVLDGEPLKIVIHASMSGFTGEELAQVLSEYRIECEFTDPDFLVLMASTENGPEDFERLKQAFSSIDPRSPVPQYVPKLPQSCMIFSPRKAILAPSETLSLDAAAGRVCASPTVACPPAVPIVMSGEEITEEHIRVMRYYGYKHIDVIKSEG